MKKLLINRFDSYQKWPTWLLVLLGCGFVEACFWVGNIIFGIVLISCLLLLILLTGQPLDFNAFMDDVHIDLISFAFVAMILFAWVKWVEKRSLVTLGFYKEKWLKELLIGFGVGALQFSLSLLLVYLLGGNQFKGVDVSSTTLLFVLSIIPFWLIQGGTEELLTRGWLLPLIHSRLGLPIAVGISSFLFGLMHLGNDHMTFFAFLDLILSGIVMALYMLYRDNLWSVVGLHGAWNFVQGNIYGIEVSGSDPGVSIFHFASNPNAPTWLSGGGFGIEGSLISCLVELVFILVVLYLMKNKDKIADGSNI